MPLVEPHHHPSLEERLRSHQRILVANNGLAALKFISSVSEWTQRSSLPRFQFVVMASPTDIASRSTYLELGSEIVEVPDGPSRCNYGNLDVIVSMAQKHRISAVWPGWGHASENPELPRRLRMLKIHFIGPDSEPMFLLGDKIRSLIIAQTAHLPCVPWSGSHLSIQSLKLIDTECQKAFVDNPDQAKEVAAKIGYPLMVKASEGGGGKGIRKIDREEDIKEALRTVKAESGDSPIFLMQSVSNCRHLEIQVLADRYGNVATLLGRDCTVQRRNQKLIEEGPISVAPLDVCAKMEVDAVRLVRAVGYFGVGTVEFLYRIETNEYFFLELNPRLQVEHPVTELVTGINLPAAQILISCGENLEDMGLAKEYIVKSLEDRGEGFYRRHQKHVIAVRINAEDPNNDFMPNTGKLHYIDFRPRLNFSGYFSIGPSSCVHSFADSQFGHLFAVGSSRSEAIDCMRSSLGATNIHAEFDHTLSFAKKVLKSRIFQSNAHLTTSCGAGSFVRDEHVLPEDIICAYIVLAIASRFFINNPTISQYSCNFFIADALCNCNVLRLQANRVVLKNGNDVLVACYFESSNGCLLVTIDGVGTKKLGLSGKEDVTIVEVDEESVRVTANRRSSASMNASSSGKITRIYAMDGTVVKPDDNILEMEVMKMCVNLKATTEGTLKLKVGKNEDVRRDQCLFTVEPSMKVAENSSKKVLNVLNIQSNNNGAHPLNDEIVESVRRLLTVGFLAAHQATLRSFSYHHILRVCEIMNDHGRQRMLEYQWQDYISFLNNAMAARVIMNDIPNPTMLSNLKFQVSKLRSIAPKTVQRDVNQLHERFKIFDAHRHNSLYSETEKVLLEKSKNIDNLELTLKENRRTVAINMAPAFLDHAVHQVRKAAFVYYFGKLYDIIDYEFEERGQVIIFKWNYDHLTPGRYNGSLSMISSWKRGLATFVKRLEAVDALPLDNVDIVYIFTDEDNLFSLERSAIVNMLRSLPLPDNSRLESITISHTNFYSSCSVRMLTFDAPDGMRENVTVRNIDPELSYLLELDRILANYTIIDSSVSQDGNIHVFLSKAKGSEQPRLFLRIIIRPDPSLYDRKTIKAFWNEAANILVEAFHLTECLMSDCKSTLISSHIFINLLPIFTDNVDVFEEISRLFFHEFHELIDKYDFTECEMRTRLMKEDGKHSSQYRLMIQRLFADILSVYSFVETKSSMGTFILIPHKNWRPIEPELLVEFKLTAHEKITKLDIKRHQAKEFGTFYLYDLRLLLEYILGLKCGKLHRFLPLSLVNGRLALDRDDAASSCGMMAWLIEYSISGTARQMVVIGNDITVGLGAFSIVEDQYFAAVSDYCSIEGIPRVYIAVNSGAKIGMAEEIFESIKCKFRDNNRESEVEYLFLELDDYEKTSESVQASKVWDESLGRHVMKLSDIIGQRDGLGVENLSGSALTAKSTSVAYESTFTISIVTGRTVGIGAYLMRLGYRVIQKQNQPIILTGNHALNKLLGGPVYVDNNVIGGTHVMAANGITHIVAESDVDALCKCLDWISFTPLKAGQHPVRCLAGKSILPRRLQHDVNLDDPRNLLQDDGLLDDGSFIECMAQWAKTVVVGRGRLGGFPIGIIATENRAVQCQPPLDPACPGSCQPYPQAGQVWFPDSAYKTASALRDFRQRGENLPVLILANWRGFSGGTRDMYEGILKFGSMIVEELVRFRQPVFVYIIGTLRGGSWVVLDSQLNPEFIEMYAEPRATGGVMEPDGVLAVKFKAEGDNMKTLCGRLGIDYKTASKVALRFLELHDTAGRMEAKGIIKGIVPWEDARNFFINRLESYYSIQ